MAILTNFKLCKTCELGEQPPPNRSQYCQVNGGISKQSSMISGIPQGSIIDPLLFLLYINDLPNCLNSVKCNMFADDTQIDTSSMT
jgi:retron-type reverse transcriptase